MNKKINLLYFPLNIMIIDDDLDTLNMIGDKLDGIKSISKFCNPMDSINASDPISLDIKDFIDNLFNGILDINFKNIKNFVDLCENKTGIIISDYDMPDINGITLLENYKNYNAIKN